MPEEKSLFNCPKCKKSIEKKQDWIDHIKKEHPEIEVLRWGTEKINLKNGS